jgi:hypothetical protein
VRRSTPGVVHERIRHGLDERAVGAAVLEEFVDFVRVDFGDADECLPKANLPPVGGPQLKPKAAGVSGCASFTVVVRLTVDGGVFLCACLVTRVPACLSLEAVELPAVLLKLVPTWFLSPDLREQPLSVSDWQRVTVAVQTLDILLLLC